MNVRLRDITIWVVGAMGLLGLAASIALIDFAHSLHTTSASLYGSAESINAAQELEDSLLAHARESMLWGVTHESQHLVRRDESRVLLHKWFREIELHIGGQSEQQLLSEAEKTVDGYLAERDRLEAESVPASVISERIEPTVDRAKAMLEKVTAINVLQARNEFAAATDVGTRANLVGGVVVALIFLIIPIVLWVVNANIVKPLSKVDLSIRALADRQPVVPLDTGVTELRNVSKAVVEMAADLNQQRENQLRYLAAVAHDLRNPLSAIAMSSELIAQDETLCGDTKQCFDVIHRQTTFLGRMVSDLLDTTRIESGHLELNRKLEDVRGVVTDCAELFRNYSTPHRIVLSTGGEPITCSIDPLRISQVVNNLISNAIKYSPYGGDVIIVVEDEGHQAVIEVIDRGAGINVDELEQIFEPFKRSKSTKGTIPGVGLGLFTARKIVNAHGGHIEVESVVGVGSTFRVCLPLASRASQSRSGASLPSMT